MNTAPCPVVAVVGKSNSGKTTLIVKLVQELTQRGHRVGTVKHAHRGFDMDRPGKDSYRHQEAGSSRTIVISPERIAEIRRTEYELPLDEILQEFVSEDIVLVEGFKTSGLQKIEVCGPGQEPLFARMAMNEVMAIASDEDSTFGSIPQFHRDDYEGLATFLEDRVMAVRAGMPG